MAVSLPVYLATAGEKDVIVPGAVPIVTSLTPEYCETLISRINALIYEAQVPPTHEVLDLSTQGQRMCAHGQMRGGVMRLRKALILLQEIADSR